MKINTENLVEIISRLPKATKSFPNEEYRVAVLQEPRVIMPNELPPVEMPIELVFVKNRSKNNWDLEL